MHLEKEVRVDVLSRFRSDDEARDVVRRLAAGEIDIVIGTHRLLQPSIEFANLGLVIIDEEQRFGVTHKDRLKRLRLEVDVLTLSATPIPRTLHLALLGIRDISNLETPPPNRLSIETRTVGTPLASDPVLAAVLMFAYENTGTRARVRSAFSPSRVSYQATGT